MPVEMKFNFNQLRDLDQDLKGSEKSIAVIVQKVMKEQFRELRNELRSFIPRRSGHLQRSFGFTVRKTKPGVVTSRLGFIRTRKVSASTAIAANVLQAGGANPRRGHYLWIPLPANRNADGSAVTTPRQLLGAGGFVATSGAGNRIAFQKFGNAAVPAFLLRKFVKVGAPVPIEARVERQLPEITDDIEQTIQQVIEARRAVVEATVI